MLRRGCLTPICHRRNTGSVRRAAHPFAFTISGTETGVSAIFLQRPAGVFSFGLLTLDLGGGGATPLGAFGIAINSSAGNGSAEAYYGDLEFQLTRTSGLSTDDFITNAAIDPGSAGPA